MGRVDVHPRHIHVLLGGEHAFIREFQQFELGQFQ